MGRDGETHSGKSFEDHSCILASKSRTTEVGLNIDPCETERGCLPESLLWEDVFLVPLRALFLEFVLTELQAEFLELALGLIQADRVCTTERKRQGRVVGVGGGDGYAASQQIL